MTTNRTFLSHGVAIGVRTNDPALLGRMTECLPPGWEDGPAAGVDSWYSLVSAPSGSGQRVRYQLFQDQRMLDEGFRLTRLLECMDSAIRLEVGRRTPQRLFVHAGAVAWNDRCIVMPGRSGTGKTTLVAALVRAGAAYCSDEYAVLDEQGLVHPYTRPMSFRQGGHRRVKRSAVSDFGGRQAAGPLPVGLVVHTRYRPGSAWDPRPLSSGESALSLFANVLVARERPAFAFSVLSRAVSDVDSLSGDRGEADAAAVAILSYADRSHSFTEGIPS